MNYPVWNFPVLGGSLVVAIIAIIHILISHLAIGGGAFLAVAEIWSNKIDDGERVRKWLHKFATFFLVYTTVFGAITGVGIWFSIQLASPEATSLLIHQFVFAWATEWVTFIGELTVLYLYYYGWNSNSRKMQVFLAVSYFVIAWFSLFIINGILTFMLTPGGWTLENRDIALGFFNPGFVPSLLIRTLTMLLIAGLAGILIATRITDEDFKTKIIRFSAKFAIPAAILVPALGLWYWYTLPESTLQIYSSGTVGVDGGKMEGLARYFWLAVTSGALIVVGVSIAAWKPKAVHLATAISLLLVAQVGIMGAEFFREMARKPYVIKGVFYSNGLWQHQSEDSQYMSAPYFSNAKWKPESVTPMTPAHGEWIYRLQCATCHTIDGYRNLSPRTKMWSPSFGIRFLDNLHEQGVMPPFQGTLNDKAALTSYFLSLHGNQILPTEVLDTYKKEEKAKKEAMDAKAKETK